MIGIDLPNFTFRIVRPRLCWIVTKTASHQGFSLFGATQCLCLVLASSFRLVDHGGFVTNLPAVHQATRLHERTCVSRIPFHWFVCTFNWVPPKKRPRKNCRQAYFFRRGWYEEIRSGWWKQKWTYDTPMMIYVWKALVGVVSMWFIIDS